MKISDVVGDMDPPRYTTSQAAALVGRSVDTLNRWKKNGVYRPSESKAFGSLDVDIYTSDDIVLMRQIAMQGIKPGPKTQAKT